jgi:hypothetical protein
MLRVAQDTLSLAWAQSQPPAALGRYGIVDMVGRDRSNLRRDMMWYRKQRRSLLRRYAGQYVAIVDSKLVDHDRDCFPLADRVFARFGDRPIYIPRVEARDRVIRIRSPRLWRSIDALPAQAITRPAARPGRARGRPRRPA